MKKLLLAFVLAFAVTLAVPALEAKGQEEVKQVEVNYEKAVRIAEKANAKIEKLVFVAQHRAEVQPQKVEAIIEQLVERTNEISAKAIEKIEELGFTAVCEYETYIIGGYEVEIDPLRVYGW